MCLYNVKGFGSVSLGNLVWQHWKEPVIWIPATSTNLTVKGGLTQISQSGWSNTNHTARGDLTQITQSGVI